MELNVHGRNKWNSLQQFKVTLNTSKNNNTKSLKKKKKGVQGHLGPPLLVFQLL